MNESQEIFKELNDAVHMGFQRRNKSMESKNLCVTITNHILDIETRGRSRKRKDKLSFMLGVELILADLMVASSIVESRWVYRSSGNDRFSHELVKRVTFKKVINLMESGGLVERARGGNHSNPFHNGEGKSKAFNPGLATRFRVTESLLSIAATYGIEPENIPQHYLRTLPTNVIKKRASPITQHGRRVNGRVMPVVRSDEHESLARDVKVINRYLDKQHLENAVFSGYYRSFNMGDEPSFNWDKGGRLYSPGKDSYQKLKKEQRISIMRINHEPVAEVDINASYLSIFYGMNGYPLPAKEDLYKVPGLHRSIVKAWINSAFGKGALPTRWPSEAKAELIANGICMDKLTMTRVGSRICTAIPILKLLATSKITWADLMYLESCAIISAMDSLRENFNIPAYSMRDGLIVPVSGKEIAANEIMRAFDDLGLECRVKIETQS